EPVEIKRRPATSYMAQFSLQYGVACCLVRGKFGLEEIEDAALNNPTITAMARRVECEADPHSGFPKTRDGEIILAVNDGRELRKRVTLDPDDPIPEATIVGKFMDNARSAISETRAAAICKNVLALEDEAEARRFSASLSKMSDDIKPER